MRTVKVTGYAVICDRCGGSCVGTEMGIAWKTIEAAQLCASETFHCEFDSDLGEEHWYCNNCVKWAPNGYDILVKPGIVIHIEKLKYGEKGSKSE